MLYYDFIWENKALGLMVEGIIWQAGESDSQEYARDTHDLMPPGEEH